jgi:hypothetical protein
VVEELDGGAAVVLDSEAVVGIEVLSLDEEVVHGFCVVEAADWLAVVEVADMLTEVEDVVVAQVVSDVVEVVDVLWEVAVGAQVISVAEVVHEL